MSILKIAKALQEGACLTEFWHSLIRLKVSEMAWRVNMLIIQLNGLNSAPGTHMMEKKKLVPGSCSLNTHTI